MHNLFGDIRLEAEGGSVDRQIVERADSMVAALFGRLSDQLDEILSDTGVLDEPTWRSLSGSLRELLWNLPAG